ncbi:MAG: hypothetical protein J6B10_08810 [Lachnospiraceae bacterium]|nr:hypothetical protein [Lachnospiraceae bacterium]
MKKISYWDQFMVSGRVEDYLKFKSAKEEATAADVREEGDPNAGFCCGNGDGAKGDAYR